MARKRKQAQMPKHQLYPWIIITKNPGEALSVSEGLPPIPSVNREFAKGWIAELREKWEESGTPLCVWEAYSAARHCGLSIPEWVTDYLDKAAFELLKKERNSIGELPKIFGFTPGKGPHSLFARFYKWKFRRWTRYRINRLFSVKEGLLKITDEIRRGLNMKNAGVEEASKGDLLGAEKAFALRTMHDDFLKINREIASFAKKQPDQFDQILYLVQQEILEKYGEAVEIATLEKWYYENK